MLGVDPLLGTFLLVAVGIGGAAAVGGSVRARREYRAMADGLALHGFLARRLPTPFSPGLDGTFRSRAGSVRRIGRGKHDEAWSTRVTLACATPSGFSLRVEPHGLGTDIEKAFGREDPGLNDPAFDAVFRLRTNDRALAKRVLDADARASLIADAPRRLEVRSGRATVLLPGRVSDAARIAASFTLAAGIVERMESAR